MNPSTLSRVSSQTSLKDNRMFRAVGSKWSGHFGGVNTKCATPPDVPGRLCRMRQTVENVERFAGGGAIPLRSQHGLPTSTLDLTLQARLASSSQFCLRLGGLEQCCFGRAAGLEQAQKPDGCRLGFG